MPSEISDLDDLRAFLSLETTLRAFHTAGATCETLAWLSKAKAALTPDNCGQQLSYEKRVAVARATLKSSYSDTKPTL